MSKRHTVQIRDLGEGVQRHEEEIARIWEAIEALQKPKAKAPKQEKETYATND